MPAQGAPPGPGALVRCGSCCKVPVKVHWSLFFSAPLWFFLFMREWQLALWEYCWGASLVLCLILSLFVHELGHVLAMRLTGLGTSSVILHGFGGMTVPANAVAQAAKFETKRCVAIGNFFAGPAANLALGALLFTGRSMAQMSGAEEGPIIDFWHGDDISLWLLYAAFMNLALAVYNLLPIYPLDGGHMFYYLFSICLPERWARYATTGITFIMAIGVVFVESLALSAGEGSVVSLVLVALICFAAVLMSCATSYDSYSKYKKLGVPSTVEVGRPTSLDARQTSPARPTRVRIQELPENVL